jgi:SNF2 family DNA or RNA helicase
MNRYLVKIADELKPHQNRALAKMDQTGGVVLDHSMGSGKTKTFLTAIERAQKRDPNGRSLIIAPASLTTNVDKEILKHHMKIDMSKVDVLSYEKAAIDAAKLRKNKYMLAIADEAQKLRNPGTQRHEELSGIISKADQRLLATGTPVYNHISDIGPLVNIAAGGHKVLPEGKASFEKEFVSKKKVSAPFLKRIFGAPPKEVSVLKNKKELSERLNTFVDSYDLASDPIERKHFPTQSEKVIEVEMSAEQHMLYKHLEGKLPWRLRLKVRMNTPLTPQETSQLQSFSTGIRQISNDTSKYFPKYNKTTPKIGSAVDSIQKGLMEDKNFKSISYSNFKESGVDAMSKELTKRGITHEIFDGSLSKKQKDLVRDNYNSGKNRVMLITSSGAEGIDTQGTKKIQILEPHWNDSKIKQVIGRGVRYKSHDALPESERHVDVERYHSVLPKGFLGHRPNSIDHYLHANAQHKNELGDQMKALTRPKNVSKS